MSFLAAGDEAAGSADYRVDLIALVPDMTWFGVSPSFTVLSDGTLYYGDYRSIDSTILLMGLRFGLVPMLLFCLMLVVATVSVFVRPSPAAVALVAQIPALTSVALITQYGVFLWFVGGLAVASYTLGAQRRSALDRGGRSLTYRVGSTA